MVDGWVRRQSWRIPEPCRCCPAAGTDSAVGESLVVSRRDGVSTTLELHHLIGSIDGVEHLVEAHVMTLFSDDEYHHDSPAPDSVLMSP